MHLTKVILKINALWIKITGFYLNIFTRFYVPQQYKNSAKIQRQVYL